MRPQTKILLVLLSVTLNVAFVVGWSVRMMRASPGDAPAVRAASLHQQLDLTPAQWRQIEPLLVEFRRASSAKIHEVGQRRNELLELLAAPQPDRTRIDEKRREIQAGQQRNQDLVVAHILAETQILTLVQRQRYFDLLKQNPNGPARAGMGRLLHEAETDHP